MQGKTCKMLLNIVARNGNKLNYFAHSFRLFPQYRNEINGVMVIRILSLNSESL